MSEQAISFSFGANWQNFLQDLSPERIKAAEDDILKWLDPKRIQGRTILDIGCGSGLHSLVFHQLGAARLISIDIDPKSVEATRSLWEKAGSPENWVVREGSILDEGLVEELAAHRADIVYSWGVLHHTGDLWKAVDHAVRLVAPGGLLWIALYVKGPRYPRDLALKQRYNRSSTLGKKLIHLRFVLKSMVKLIIARRPLEISRLIFARRSDFNRGMSIHWDIIDWLGGLPYEVASAGEVVEFTRPRGLVLEKIETGNEGGNHIYLFSMAEAPKS